MSKANYIWRVLISNDRKDHYTTLIQGIQPKSRTQLIKDVFLNLKKDYPLAGEATSKETRSIHALLFNFTIMLITVIKTKHDCEFDYWWEKE